MATELKIKWEGSLPSIVQKRLSIAAFGKPISSLLSIVRRIASNIVSDAIEANKLGRLADASKQIDIEITEVIRESSGFDSVITMLPPLGENMHLFSDLPQRATLKLLESIEMESKGEMSNALVRDFLLSLPPEINSQSYILHSNGTVIKTVNFGSLRLPPTPKEIPYLVKAEGMIAGVGFDPFSIRVKPTSQAITFLANEQQVEVAVQLRHSKVMAVGVKDSSGFRLLILQDQNKAIYKSTRETVVFEKWNGLLERLAK